MFSKEDLSISAEQGLKGVFAVYGYTVNLKIYTSVLFSHNFSDAKFRDNKTLVKWGNHRCILIFTKNFRNERTIYDLMAFIYHLFTAIEISLVTKEALTLVLLNLG